MIISFEPGTEEGKIQEVLDVIRELNYEVKDISGVGQRAFGVMGEIANGAREAIKGLTRFGCVEKILEISKKYKTILGAASNIIVKGGVSIDKQHLEIIGGPCAVESKAQIYMAAEMVKAAGSNIIRGGAYKPRSDSEDWGGLELEGLQLLRGAADSQGLAVITEVLDPRDVGAVACLTDILQIGSRNMHNHRLIREAAATGKPVLVKRGYSATIDEYLKSAKAVVVAGNPNLILCERGVRTFEPTERYTMDLNMVAFLHDKYPSLVVCADPSHGTGDRDLVSQIALASVMAGADGLLVEAHPNPEQAITDGDQSLPFEGKHSFRELVNSAQLVYALRKALEKGTTKKPLELYDFLTLSRTTSQMLRNR